MAIQLLAPAGSKEALYAAAMCGADAVYFGAKDFNARKNAKNFTDEEISECIKFCKIRGIKTYATINTIVSDSEIDAVLDTIKHIYLSGADGVIITDLAVLKIVKSVAPDLEIVASTQMTVHNLYGVKLLEDMGFTRVVLSRELSKKDIEYIAKNARIETEVFVHGALCMCYSGSCLMSAHLGGRSGNRGLCAQPCRLDYELGGKKGPLLSLKDLCLLDEVLELEKMGVKSLKIEGRKKRTEYIIETVTAYRNAIDRNETDGNEKKRLEEVFSRSGFTKGYYDNRLKDMFGTRTFKDKQKSEKQFSNLYKETVREGHEYKRISIKARVYENNGFAVLEIIDCDNNKVEFTGPKVIKAENAEKAREIITASLKKIKNTPYYFEKDEDIDIQCDAFLVMSEINNMRKQALQMLDELRGKVNRSIDINRFEKDIKQIETAEKDLKIHLRFYKKSQIPNDLSGVEIIWLYMQDIDKEVIDKAKSQGVKVGVIGQQTAFYDETDSYKNKLKDLFDMGVKDLLCQNLWNIKIGNELGFKLLADFHLNIFNSHALSQYKNLGCESACLSVELSYNQIKSLQKSIQTGILAYGRTPLMTYRNCIIKENHGCDKNCENGIFLKDRKNESFLILKDKNSGRQVCGNCLYNAKTMVLAGEREYLNIGIDFIMLNFTLENEKQCEAVIEAYKAKKPLIIEGRTYGLYRTGVE